MTIGHTDEEINLRLMSDSRRYHRWIIEQFLPYLRGPRVLEVGAGVGNMTGQLVERGYRVTCLDVNPRNLDELARRHPGVQVVCGDVVGATLAQTFESILCINVLEHISDDQGALRSMRRLLRPAGRLLVLVPAVPAIYGALDLANRHQRRYSRPALRAVMERAGFRVSWLRYMNLPGLIGWWWEGRVMRRRVHRPPGLLLFDRLVPVLKRVERIVPPPIGLSLLAVAEPDAGP